MIKSIFECISHFEYLKINLKPEFMGRGVKTRFSKFIRIQPAFLSQVLAQKYCLSLEQGDLANQFFDHSVDEAKFFLLLLSRDRAGTPSLKKHFQEEIQIILKKRMSVVERLGKRSELSDEDKGIYYSSWIYAAIHVACTISNLRTRREIARQFNLPMKTVGEVLDFLVKAGLLNKEMDVYLPTKSWVRLDKSSPHIVKHHSNWRLKAIQNLEVQTDQDLHYSGVFSIDEEAAHALKDKILSFLKEELAKFDSAKEEKLFVVGVDFFSLLGQGKG